MVSRSLVIVLSFLSVCVIVLSFLWLYLFEANSQCTIENGYFQLYPQYEYTLQNGNNFRTLPNGQVPVGSTLFISTNKIALDKVKCIANGRFDKPLPYFLWLVIIAEDYKQSNLYKDFPSFIPAEDLRNFKMFKGCKLISRKSQPAARTMFRVGYEDNRGFVELYRTLYDSHKLASELSINNNYGRTIIQNERLSWRTDGIVTSHPADFYNSYRDDKIRQLLYKYVNAAEFQNLNLTSGNVIDRVHLAPRGDFFLQSQATFELFNAVPQFAPINKCDWNDVELYVRDQSMKVETTVVTGSKDVLRLGNKKLYLFGSDKLPVPEWIYKVVVQKVNNLEKVTVFMGYNNMFGMNLKIKEKKPLCHRYTWGTKLQPPCKTVACPQIRFTGDGSFIFCCEPKAFAKDNSVIDGLYKYK